jgi:divalent metal cation (Fe/Co/Zn/Cd) transporter
MNTFVLSLQEKNKYYKYAFLLALITILYNLLEGLVSTYFGYEDESLALFGFGIDSFIEVVSGLGIAHMVLRIKMNPDSNRDNFERTALRITGFAFYLLVFGLISSGIYNIWVGHKPQTTLWGVIISTISIITMWLLIFGKTKVGKILDSEAILADAGCTRVCFYMSLILLFSSGIYELTSIAYIDSIGAIGLSYFAFNEGRECFEKAKSNKICACDHS